MLDDIEQMSRERRAAVRDQRLRAAHAAGFARGQNRCGKRLGADHSSGRLGGHRASVLVDGGGLREFDGFVRQADGVAAHGD